MQVPGDPAPAGPSRPLPPFVQELDTLVRARYPLVYLVTSEEQRVEAILADLARSHGKALLGWSATKGLRRLDGAKGPLPAAQSPLDALAAVEKLSEPSLVVLEDFHPYLQDPQVVRALRDLAHALKSTYATAILLSPSLVIPPEVEKEISVLDVPLPTYGDLLELLKQIVGVVRRSENAKVELTNADADQLVQAALGLTLSEAESAFAKAIATDGRLSRADVPLVLEEKRQVIRKSGLLEYFAPDAKLADVGGLDALKAWLARRGAAFSEAARRFGLPQPKGLLLLGVQGCGKSLTAKAIAAQWGLPLLRLDMGRIFSGLVGSSEENLRKAIRVAESVAPVVLWVDEIEKGLSGSQSSGMVDGGVSARVFGALLTWLQEKTAPVFVVATANRIEQLPPELLRKGRFDELFFIDLPAAAERREIFEIHLTKRRRDPAAFDTAALAARARGFSGAEIEQAVISALYDAFAERTDLSQAQLERAVTESLPLSTTMREEIERLRAWARARTRPASTPCEEEATP
ncbi:AAA family ATPase [Anaeromyxobacter oryzisoli]|jgi:AAA+ superfamily predicted ATPase|uniref:AAA family ATPase n=1 Tax=Anaeromyxobacter oryzisoli TaxID=2925408 RepID=UPI001F580A43|nr:AAA family ATPase [Anaeromyxobacter sp. SG63]